VGTYAPTPLHLGSAPDSLRAIIIFVNMDVSRHILVVDTSVLEKSNMDRREYIRIFLNDIFILYVFGFIDIDILFLYSRSKFVKFDLD
jgi:hypothetical protein